MHVFLADFGLSKVMNECDVAGTTTMKAGTPGFQAPKQLKSEGISAKCDMYAFGGVLTEMYGEMPLWPKMAPHQIMFSVAVKGVYPLTSHLPLSIEAIVKMCLTCVEERASSIDVLTRLLSL